MRKFMFLIAAAAALAAFTAGAARSAPADCPGDPAWNVIAFNAEWGFRPYLLGLGSSSWRGKERIAGVPATAACGALAQKLAADQQRFYTLLRAFPVSPTRAQWKARFRPLLASAIAADSDFLAFLRGSTRTPVVADKAWLVAAQHTPFGKTPQ